MSTPVRDGFTGVSQHMTPHTQTIFGNGTLGATPGNCVQTAIASLLDLPLDQVPHLILFHDWFKATKLWLDGRDKTLRIYTDNSDQGAYWEHIGVEVYPLSAAPAGELLLASGASHNGPWSHIVLWQDGLLVHDTHPNGKGLKGTPTEYWHVTS